MEHQFNTNIAKDFNVNIAILLHNLKFWTLTNLAKSEHIYDGLCWSYNTLESFGDLFPYWTKSQLETILMNAIKFGLIVKGNYNQTKYDRTCWYALTPTVYHYFPELAEQKFIDRLLESISEKSEIEKVEFRNRFPENRTPIPDSKPDSKPDTPTPLPLPKVKKEKITFSLESMKESNPHNIPDELFIEWQEIRKKPITPRVWDKTNGVLTKLSAEGLRPIEAFEIMLEKQWAGIEYRYFEQELKFRKTGTGLSLVSSKPAKYTLDEVMGA